MAEPFIGEIRIFSFGFAPKGWAMCNGQLLAINQNQALFSILGTTYGGNGQTTFALPNLQGSIPIHFGTDPFGNNYNEGQKAGEATHILTLGELPQHTHTLNAANPAGTAAPANNLPGKGTSAPFYDGAPNTTMNPLSVTNTGGSQPHENMSPYLTINFCIALVGIFPSRN
jgi:microcystin-dependent protein